MFGEDIDSGPPTRAPSRRPSAIPKIVVSNGKSALPPAGRMEISIRTMTPAAPPPAGRMEISIRTMTPASQLAAALCKCNDVRLSTSAMGLAGPLRLIISVLAAVLCFASEQSSSFLHAVLGSGVALLRLGRLPRQRPRRGRRAG
jgi:hypothetical protein